MTNIYVVCFLYQCSHHIPPMMPLMHSTRFSMIGDSKLWWSPLRYHIVLLYFPRVCMFWVYPISNFWKNFTILKTKSISFHFINWEIVGPKNQNCYAKLNVPCFWNNYIVCTIILNPKVPQRVVIVMCFHPLMSLVHFAKFHMFIRLQQK